MTTGQASLVDWVKNNLVTIAVVVGGFIATIWQMKGDVGVLQSQLSDQKTQLQQIQSSQSDERVESSRVRDTLEDHGRDISAINKHLEAVDGMISNIKDTVATQTTNLQLVNQQLQYIGTAHIQPSIKK